MKKQRENAEDDYVELSPEKACEILKYISGMWYRTTSRL